MLAVSAVLPDEPSTRPPVVLIHGAANSAIVWTFWQRELATRGYASYAVDLRGHGASPAIDLSHTSMHDYADDVRALLGQLSARAVVMGWSMGGLVAILACARPTRDRPRDISGARHAPIACVGLAPSTPSKSVNAAIKRRTGEFDATEYGITSDDPDAQPAMPDLDRQERIIALASLNTESRYARDERAGGIVIDALPCPLLIATGADDTQWPRSRYDALHLDADYVSIDDASHWGLVLNQRALATLVPAVTRWIERAVSLRS
ncbi:MAG TPA: alpha/beta hydrolase [Dehalococcoidia bacterium]